MASSSDDDQLIPTAEKIEESKNFSIFHPMIDGEKMNSKSRPMNQNADSKAGTESKIDTVEEEFNNCERKSK